MIAFKETVRLHPQTSPHILEALAKAERIFALFGLGVVVTSWADGQHKADSLHYIGRAIDLRIKHVAEEDRDRVYGYLADQLGPSFDVLWESRGSQNEHLHIEYDPKGGTA